MPSRLRSGYTPRQSRAREASGCRSTSDQASGPDCGDRPLGSASSWSPTTPPHAGRRPSTACPSRSPRTVDHVMVCDDASTDDTYEVGLRLQERVAPADHGGPHASTTSATAATRRPATRWADRARPRHRGAAARRRPVRPRGDRGLVEPLRRGEADAVFGSRMMERGEARAGGMPLYKYVGNRILTTLPEPAHRRPA